MSRRLNLVGQRFGKLLVIKLDRINPHNHLMWLCKCDCGNEKTVLGGSLRNGETKSCGCLRVGIPDRVLPLGIADFNRKYILYLSNSKRKNLEFLLTEEQFRDIITKDCIYCGSEPKEGYKYKTNGVLKANGVDRLDSSKGYTLDNCVPCCSICNYAKRKMSKEEFISWITKVYNHSVKNSDNTYDKLN